MHARGWRWRNACQSWRRYARFQVAWRLEGNHSSFTWAAANRENPTHFRHALAAAKQAETSTVRRRCDWLRDEASTVVPNRHLDAPARLDQPDIDRRSGAVLHSVGDRLTDGPGKSAGNLMGQPRVGAVVDPSE